MLPQDLLEGGASGQEIENQGDPETVAPDARLPEADLRVDGDAGEKLLSSWLLSECHAGSPRGYGQVHVRRSRGAEGLLLRRELSSSS